jgi:Flp pilus assembly pilin Flp
MGGAGDSWEGMVKSSSQSIGQGTARPRNGFLGPASVCGKMHWGWAASMKNFLRRIVRERDAMTLVEYGLLVGVLGLSIVFGMNAFTNQLFRLWHIVEDHTNAASKPH